VLDRSKNSATVSVARSKAIRHLLIFSRALVYSALFYASLPVQASNCKLDRIDTTAIVARVHDGDTLRLTDQRKVRLIGINTPELARDQQAEQAFARQARQALIQLLRSSNNRISMRYGQQRTDKYQRTLAHLYLPDGRNIQQLLISQGLATAFTTPPNNQLSHCYRQAEQAAIKQALGIWSLPEYQVKQLHQLDASDKGFRRVEGKVSQVRHSSKASWIQLGNQLRLRIKKADRINFSPGQLDQLKGKTIRVRGWLHPNKQHYFMNLRHPDAITPVH
jgi:endonuclease YncB( thermonuclease family)